MHLQNLITRLLRYNLWANDRLASWILTLERQVIYTPTGSSFGTIDRTIQHILEAQVYWHNVIVNGQIGEVKLSSGMDATHLVSALVASSHQLIDDISIFNEQQLIEAIQVSDSKQSRYEYVLHMVNHGSYHRGQVVTMCRALGVKGEIPVTDYDAYLWWIENHPM